MGRRLRRRIERFAKLLLRPGCVQQRLDLARRNFPFFGHFGSEEIEGAMRPIYRVCVGQHGRASAILIVVRPFPVGFEGVPFWRKLSVRCCEKGGTTQPKATREESFLSAPSPGVVTSLRSPGNPQKTAIFWRNGPAGAAHSNFEPLRPQSIEIANISARRNDVTTKSGGRRENTGAHAQRNAPELILDTVADSWPLMGGIFAKPRGSPPRHNRGPVCRSRVVAPATP